MFNIVISIYDIITFFIIITIPFGIKYYLNKKTAIFIFLYSCIISIILIITFLWIKNLYMQYLINSCINNPVLYGSKIPVWCSNINFNKYMGIGWPVTAVFRITIDSIYLLIFVGIIKIFKTKE